MKIEIAGFDILNYNQWVEEQMYYKVAIILTVGYLAYICIIYAVSVLYNLQKVHYKEVAVSTARPLIQKELEHILASVHGLSKRQKVIIHLKKDSQFRFIIGSTSKKVLQSTIDTIFASAEFTTSNYTPPSQKQKVYYSNFKLRKRLYPIKSEDKNFNSWITNFLDQSTKDTCVTYIFKPDNYISYRISRKVRKSEEGQQMNNGSRYVSEYNKRQAKLFNDKKEYPLFLTRIIISSTEFDILNKLKSHFNRFQTAHNKVRMTPVRSSTSFMKKWLRPAFFFDKLYYQPHTYLNTHELSYLLGIGKASHIQEEVQDNNHRPIQIM